MAAHTTDAAAASICHNCILQLLFQLSCHNTSIHSLAPVHTHTCPVSTTHCGNVVQTATVFVTNLTEFLCCLLHRVLPCVACRQAQLAPDPD
jgi:hypothetical protein